MNTAIPTQAEYEMRERQRHLAKLAEVEHAPLVDRRDSRVQFTVALKDPALIRERVEWLIEGCYGWGACDHAKRILSWGVRTNKPAALCLLIAAVEWLCPNKFAVEAYKSLTPRQQRLVTKAIERAMKTAPAI